MTSFKEFLKTTIVGGILFLMPLILFALILRHAMGFAAKIAKPIAAYAPQHQIAGVAVATIVAALVLLVLSFCAGLAARTRAGKNVTHWLEETLLGNLPQYRMVKSLAEGLTQVEGVQGMRPALVSIEGGWQIGYQLEELKDGWVAVFLPQSPTPMSGNVMYLPAARVRLLDMPIPEAMMLVKRMGVGSATALAAADLTPVAEG
jgi:uncharacterized membrane protein